MKFDLKTMTENQLLILTIVAACVVVGSLGGVCYLGIARYSKLRKEVDTLEMQLDQAAARVAQIKPLTAELKLRAATALQYERLLPNDANKEELLELFSNMKNETGVKISSVKINEVIDKGRSRARRSKAGSAPSVQKVEFQLALESDYFQFGRFVNLLENYPRFMAVTEFALKEPGEDLAQTISLTGCTYKYQAPAPAAGAGPSARSRRSARKAL